MTKTEDIFRENTENKQKHQKQKTWKFWIFREKSKINKFTKKLKIKILNFPGKSENKQILSNVKS